MQFWKISIILPPEGIGNFPEGHQKSLNKYMKLKWNFQTSGGRALEKYLPWERYGYFLELHIVTQFIVTMNCSRQSRKQPLHI